MKFISSFICCLFSVCAISVSCIRRGGAPLASTDNPQGALTPQDSVPSVAVTPPIKPVDAHPTINIFIENSGSMNGFINDESEFQDAIQKMMVLLKYYYDAEFIKLNYINTAIHPQHVPASVKIEDFAVQMLQPSLFTHKGNVGSTDLNDIVDLILNQVDENSISILISDCIYSIKGNGTTPVLLAGCKNKTMGAFLEKTKECPDLATTIVHLTSHFNGSYWDCHHPTGKASQTLNCERPYYMCVIGTNANLENFNEHINVDEMRGYKNKYILSCSDYSDCNYSALISSNRKSTFRIKGAMPYKVLEHARARGGQFQFAIAADLSQLPMSSTEKLDINSYDVIQGAYEVVGVHEVDPIHMHPTDKAIVESYNLTHEIIVSSNQYPTDVVIGVKKGIPQWVKDVSSTDDTSIDKDDSEKMKTFGLEYFVTGISDAYKEASPNKDYSTSFTITVKHKHK